MLERIFGTELPPTTAAGRDPDQRQFPASLALFENTSRPGPGDSGGD
jgi:hypothetical protein